jgi:YfiH family protein
LDADRRRRTAAGPADADVIVSDDPRLALVVRAADCVPLLIADRRTGAVAAAHAGWRGIAGGVPRATVRALAREFDSDPADLVAAIGPAISACCYEVGLEVRGKMADAGATGPELERWFFERPRASARNPPMPNLTSPPRANHWYFDCWAATRDGLESAGVRRDSIHAAELCTASHPDMLCSYRRDGSPAGRLAAVIRASRNGD